MRRSYKSIIKLVMMKLWHELSCWIINPPGTKSIFFYLHYVMCKKSTHLFLFRDAAMDRMKLLVLNQLKVNDEPQACKESSSSSCWSSTPHPDKQGANKEGETEETQASFLISPTREAGRGGEEETRGIMKSNFNKSKTSFLQSRHVKVLSVNYYLWHSLLLYFTIPDATHV